MKITSIRICVILLVVLCATCGCSILRPTVSSDLQDAFTKMVAVPDLNAGLKVTVLDVKSGRYGTDIHLLVENTGKNPIFLSANKNSLFVKLYAVRNSRWVELPNNSTYFSMTGGEGDILMPANSGQPNYFTTKVSPAFDTLPAEKAAQDIIRIVIVSEAMSGAQKTGVPVGAYVDFVLDR